MNILNVFLWEKQKQQEQKYLGYCLKVQYVKMLNSFLK